MAAFLPRNYYGSDASFTPLFRLLDDFDNYARQGQQGNGASGKGSSRSSILAFQPKFDVRELEDHFELHGELPGLTKEDVNIEFVDPHTMRIHGRVERSYTAGTPPAGLLQEGQIGGAIAEGSEKSSGSSKEHQATVEDDTEDGAVSHQVKKTEKQEDKKQAGDDAKYWCTERSIGQFSRSFNFPGQIRQDAVSASLKDGILNITVPKAPKHESRRIAIQ